VAGEGEFNIWDAIAESLLLREDLQLDALLLV
jgi:hypothetical protein